MAPTWVKETSGEPPCPAPMVSISRRLASGVKPCEVQASDADRGHPTGILDAQTPAPVFESFIVVWLPKHLTLSLKVFVLFENMTEGRGTDSLSR